jgi:hypothetical protein
MKQKSSVFRKYLCPSCLLHLHGYLGHHCDHLSGDRSNKGLTVCIKGRIFSAPVNIQTPLQVTIICYAHSFIYSLQHLSYLPPAVTLSPAKLAKSNFTVNPTVYSSRWFYSIIKGSVSIDDRYIVVSSVCDRFDLILLNIGVILCLWQGGSSTLDLAFYSPGLAVRLEQPLPPDLHNSDHYPVNLHIPTTFPLESWHLNWIVRSADWAGFS